MGALAPTDVILLLPLRCRGYCACSGLVPRLPPFACPVRMRPEEPPAVKGREAVRDPITAFVWARERQQRVGAPPRVGIGRCVLSRAEATAERTGGFGSSATALRLLPFPCTGATRGFLRRSPGMSTCEPGNLLYLLAIYVGTHKIRL